MAGLTDLCAHYAWFVFAGLLADVPVVLSIFLIL
jgi:hypothetical protein